MFDTNQTRLVASRIFRFEPKKNRRAEQFRAVFVYSTQYHHILELGWPDNHNLPSYVMSHVPMKSICSKGARCPAAGAPGSQSIQHHVHSLAVACEPARSLADDSWKYGWSGWSCDWMIIPQSFGKISAGHLLFPTSLWLTEKNGPDLLFGNPLCGQEPPDSGCTVVEYVAWSPNSSHLLSIGQFCEGIIPNFGRCEPIWNQNQNMSVWHAQS